MYALLTGSIFYRTASSFGDAIHRLADSSFFVRGITRYPDLTKLRQESLFGRVLSGLRELWKRARLTISATVEDSMATSAVWRVFRYFLSLDLRSWGLGVFIFGLAVCGVQLYEAALGTALMALLTMQMRMGIIISACGVILMTGSQALGNALMDSAVMNLLLVGWAGLRSDSFKAEKPRREFWLPVTLALILGVATTRISVFYLAAGIVGLIGCCVIAASPEAGLMLTLAALPFLPTIPLTLLALYTVAAFLFKVIRGKRVIAMEAVDIGVLMFAAVLLLLGGVFSINPASSLKSVALHLSYIMLYFVAANTVKSRRLIRKAAGSLLTAGFLAGLLGIYQSIVGLESSVTWIDAKMFADIGSRVIGPFDNPNVFGEYIVLLLPLAIAVAFRLRGKLQLLGAGAACTMTLALIYTWSRGAWLAAILSVGVFLLLYSSAFLKLVLPVLLIAPFTPAVLPASILNRLMSIGDMADTSTAYRVSIWTASVRMIKSMFLSGIGTGSDVFLTVYPMFALSGASYALHAHNLFLQITIEMGFVGIAVFLVMLWLFFRTVLSCYYTVKQRDTSTLVMALGMGVLALLFQGLTDYVWFNYRVMLMFWLAVGLAVGISRSYFLEQERERERS